MIGPPGPGTEPEAVLAAVFRHLESLAISYERYDHPPIFTADQGIEHWRGIEAAHCKNLFLRNQKGDRHYLVILEHHKRADLRAVAAQIGDGKLSFASPDRLLKHLGVTPGSVSPFGLMHDRERHVRVFLDADLKQAERVSFHPNLNTATLVLTMRDFERFLEAGGYEYRYVEVASR